MLQLFVDFAQGQTDGRIHEGNPSDVEAGRLAYDNKAYETGAYESIGVKGPHLPTSGSKRMTPSLRALSKQRGTVTDNVYVEPGVAHVAHVEPQMAHVAYVEPQVPHVTDPASVGDAGRASPNVYESIRSTARASQGQGVGDRDVSETNYVPTETISIRL